MDGRTEKRVENVTDGRTDAHSIKIVTNGKLFSKVWCFRGKWVIEKSTIEIFFFLQSLPKTLFWFWLAFEPSWTGNIRVRAKPSWAWQKNWAQLGPLFSELAWVLAEEVITISCAASSFILYYIHFVHSLAWQLWSSGSLWKCWGVMQ